MGLPEDDGKISKSVISSEYTKISTFPVMSSYSIITKNKKLPLFRPKT